MEKNEKIAIITMNRPEVLNAISYEMKKRSVAGLGFAEACGEEAPSYKGKYACQGKKVWLNETFRETVMGVKTSEDYYNRPEKLARNVHRWSEPTNR